MIIYHQIDEHKQLPVYILTHKQACQINLTDVVDFENGTVFIYPYDTKYPSRNNICTRRFRQLTKSISKSLEGYEQKEVVVSSELTQKKYGVHSILPNDMNTLSLSNTILNWVDRIEELKQEQPSMYSKLVLCKSCSYPYLILYPTGEAECPACSVSVVLK